MLHGLTIQIDIQDLRPLITDHLQRVIFREGQCPEIKEIRGPSYSFEHYIKVIFADKPKPTETEAQAA